MKDKKILGNIPSFQKFLFISTSFIFLFVMILSIGYASFNETLEIEGEAIVRAEIPIRFTQNSIKSLDNAGIEKASSKYTVDTISNHIELPNCSSTASYNIVIKNNSNSSTAIKSIDKELWNNDNIDYEIIGFNIAEEKIPANTEINFELKFKRLSCDTENNKLDSILKLVLNEEININYSNDIINYSNSNNPKKAFKGNTVTANFSGLEDYNIMVIINGKGIPNGKSYTNNNGTVSTLNVNNGVATVTNVNEDIMFTMNKNVYVNLSTTGPIYNYENKANLTSIEFVNYIDLSKADISWDITKDQNELAYAWVEGTNLYIGSTLEMKPDSLESAFDGMTNVTSIWLGDRLDTSEVTSMKQMFANCKKLKEIDLSSLNTKNVTTFEKMFVYTDNLVEINVSNFDTSSATNMSYMFSRTTNKGMTTNKLERIIGLENFDTSKVIYGNYLFAHCNNVTDLNISNWNTGNMTDMGFMFINMNSLVTLDVSNWNTSNNTRMDQMFSNCTSLKTLDVSRWNTSKVGNMQNVFRGYTGDTIDVRKWNTSKCNNFSGIFSKLSNVVELDLSKFNTSNVKYIDDMFADSPKLETIYVSSIWDYEKVSSLNVNMFSNSVSLVGGNGTKYDSSNISTSYARIDMDENPGYLTLKEPVNINLGTTDSYYKAAPYNSLIESIEFVDYINLSNATISWDITVEQNKLAYAWIEGTNLYIGSEFKLYSEDLSNAFYNMNTTRKIEFNDKLDTFYTTNMQNMFYACRKVESLDLSSFDTSNVTNMSGMFNSVSTIKTLDLSNFDTSNVTTMLNMFMSLSNVTNINISSFDTSKVKNMSGMFYGETKLANLDVSNFDTSSVTDMSKMFYSNSSLLSLDLSNFNTSNVTTFINMFYNCKKLTSLNLSNFNTPKVINFDGMFNTCSSLKDINISNFSTIKASSFSNMFKGCTSLTTIDLSSFNTNTVKIMDNMFYGDSNLTKIYVSDNWTISGVLSGKGNNLFYGCSNLSGTIPFDSDKVSVEYATTDYYLTLKN